MKRGARWLLLTLTAGIGVAATSGLGFWQLARAQQKLQQAQTQALQGALAPLDAEALQTRDTGALLQRAVRLRGSWDDRYTVYLDNRPMDGRVGFYVLTPLLLEHDQGAVLVQRGWIQRNFEHRTALQPVSTPPGTVEVQGRMALPPSDLYEPGAAPLERIRQNLHLDELHARSGLPLMPLVLQQTGAPSEGLLRDWPAPDRGVDKNIGYAWQWFGMAALIVVLYLWFQVLRPAAQRFKE